MNLYLYEMGLNRKKIGLVFIAVFLIVLLGLFISKYLVINKIEDYIEGLPNHIGVQYDEIDLDFLSGNLKLEQPLLVIKGKTTDKINVQIALSTIVIEDLSYWNYFKNDVIAIQAVKLFQPEVTYYHNELVDKKGYKSVLKGELDKKIRIEFFEISNGEIEVFNIENDSLLFITKNLEMQLDSITINSSGTEKLPFTFKTISFNSEDVKYSINDFENLYVSSLEIDNHNLKFQDLKLKTKYSKTELSKRLKFERDHFDLSVTSVDVQNYNLTFDANSKVTFKSDRVFVDRPVFRVCRDKLVNDNFMHKNMYSKSLRDLTFDLGLSEIVVSQAEITYEEDVELDRQAGKLEFSNFDATIKNMSNIYSESVLTSISVTSTFMKETPLKVDWNFDVNDVNDHFVFKADIGSLKAEHLNQFMQPNLNLKLEGELFRTYFTIDGNSNNSQIDLKTDYDQFDIIVLKDNGKEKNEFLSGLINLFIAKDSKDEGDRFRYSDTEVVERDKTKSVFNFIWKNVQSGLISSMAGDGKKNN